MTMVLLAASAIAAAAAQTGSGQMLYQRHCQSCHAIEAGRNTPAGPTLFGIVGRRIAAERAFNYSPALRRLGAEAKHWTAARLGAFLADPERVAPGTEMSFPGLRHQADRRALINWLAGRSQEHDHR